MPFPLDSRSKRFVEQHFKRKGNFSWTESFLINVIQTSGNKYDLHRAAIGLREVGTEQALEPLKALLVYRNYDVQGTAILTIAHVAGAEATPILVEALENTAYRQKDYALWAIADAADVRAVPYVARFFAKNKRRFKSGKLKRTPILYIVSYLTRFSGTNADAKAVLDEIPEVWLGLPEKDRKAILRALPDLAGQIESATKS